MAALPEQSYSQFRLQLVHRTRARLHHPVSMPQQLPQVPVLPARHPDPWKAIFQQQSEQQLGILAICFLLPYPLASPEDREVSKLGEH
jgi:hypothetical protein